MKRKLKSKRRKENSRIAASPVVLLEEKAAAKTPGILQFFTQGLHNSRLPGACRTM
jgi:hypothetical protein